ncbi:hypothetical protein D3C76_1557870 [compost metagenome]
MPAQAAPAAGVRAPGPEHPGDDPEEGGHGLPATGGIEGKQVGPGRVQWRVTAGQGREEFLLQWDQCRRKGTFRVVIRHQAHVRLRSGRKTSGALREKSGVIVPQSVPQKVYFFKGTF